MERIDGPTMLRELSRRPWRLWAYAKVHARLHREMHAHSARGLPLQRERLHHVIDRIAEQIGVAAAARIHRAVDELPDGQSICHGDFHPDNILLHPQGPVIIDWGLATSGNPAADIAWTVYLFRSGGTPPGMSLWQRMTLTALRRLFLAVYLRAYLRGASLTRREIRAWGPPTAALRLGDGIPKERERLLRTLRKHYGASSEGAP